MGRSRRFDALCDDAYKRADVEGATDRHPLTDVKRYINQGGAELWDLIIAARGPLFCRKDPPQTITTTANTTRYALNEDFYRLISVRRDGDFGDSLITFQAEDEPFLRQPSSATAWPSHYQLQPGFIEILPLHDANLSLIVSYIPVFTDLVDDDDELDGFDGWEEYPVAFAARCMAEKDDQPRVIRNCEADMARLKARIQALAPKRDAFRPERVRDVRATRRWRVW